jgi:hypothetical protein
MGSLAGLARRAIHPFPQGAKGRPVLGRDGSTGRIPGAGHEGDGIGHCIILGIDNAEAATEAMDMDAVGHFKDMGHVVADEDDGNAPAPAHPE